MVQLFEWRSAGLQRMLQLLDQQRTEGRGNPGLSMLSYLGHDLFLYVSDVFRELGKDSCDRINRLE